MNRELSAVGVSSGLATPTADDQSAQSTTVLQPPAPVPISVGVVIGFAAVVLVAHVVTNLITPYGVHRDEFLYMAMGRHLHLFRMDFPPLIAIVSQASRAIGDSLIMIRLGPALAAAALVAFAAMFAREFGGGRFAQLLAALAVATVPLYLRNGSLLQPVVFDELWWTIALFALTRLARHWHARSAGAPDDAPRDATSHASSIRGSPKPPTGALHQSSRWWLVLGIAGGLGLLSKFSILFLGLGVLVALLLGPERRLLLTRWPWITLAIALVLGSPSIVGQIALGVPVIGQMRDLQQGQLEHVSYGAFLTGQLLMLGPALLIAALGLGALLIGRRLGAFRVVGWATLVPFLVMMVLHGKPYYAGPIYPTIVGAGAAALAAWTERMHTRRRTLFGPLRATVLILVAAYGALTLPYGLPILPPASMARYVSGSGISAARATDAGDVLTLPQDYADMLGWNDRVAQIARIYHALPATEQGQAVIVADNYGDAGAIDFFGPHVGVPNAVAATGSYWFFGPGTKPGEVIIKVGGDREDLAPLCGSLTLAARVHERWVVPEEQDLPIWLCRHPRMTLQQFWPNRAGEN